MNFEAQMKQLCKIAEFKKDGEVKVTKEFLETYKFRYKKRYFQRS